jgi:putative PIN family toxin of toxin-antitoxin system
MIYAVIDTNVLVSALLASHADSATVMVMNAVINGDITPMYNEEILKEYEEVLSRKKFRFSKSLIKQYLNFFSSVGIASERVRSTEDFPDPKDVVFYEVALSQEDAFLVTGNTKHFPKTPIVVTPAEMLSILAKV